MYSSFYLLSIYFLSTFYLLSIYFLSPFYLLSIYYLSRSGRMSPVSDLSGVDVLLVNTHVPRNTRELVSIYYLSFYIYYLSRSGRMSPVSDLSGVDVLLVNTHVPRNTRELVSSVRTKFSQFPKVFYSSILS